MAYTFDYIDPRGQIDHFDLVICDSDEEASLAAGRALRDSSHAIRVAVWDEARRVALIDRDGAARLQDRSGDRLAV